MFTLTIKTDNDAFADNEASETARILRTVAARIEEGDLEGRAKDYNGNSVGTWVLK